MAVKTLLVCGDSFFYDDPRRFPGLHWSHRLPTHIQVQNVAATGASNTMIMEQFIDHFRHHDSVIFGFTGPWRLEFANTWSTDLSNLRGKWLTSCHDFRLTDRQKQFSEQYQQLISPDAEIVRQCSIMFAAVEMARALGAQVHYSLSGGQWLVQALCEDYPINNRYAKRFLEDSMPFNLSDYLSSDEYRPYFHLDGTENHPSFHVHLPEIQQRFADQVCELVDKV